MNIYIISCGGTIVSHSVNGTLVPSSLNDGLIEIIKNNCSYPINTSISGTSLFNLDSTELTPNHWLEIAANVDKIINKYDAIIITTGTDTLAYTAAALTAMLENVPIPVVLTGSMLPLTNKKTDAINNLQLALDAAHSSLKGVFVAFNGKIINGDSAVKISSANINAFASANKPYVKLNEVTKLNGEYKFNSEIKNKAACIKITPGLTPDVIDAFIKLGYTAFVLEVFGKGGISAEFEETLKTATKNGVRFIAVSQCHSGGTDLKAYKVGEALLNAGVDDGGKITTEFALAKLMLGLK